MCTKCEIMYKLSDFKKDNSTNNSPSFVQMLKSKWNEIHSDPDIFRYKINNLQERVLDEKYLLMVNTERGTNRRTPEDIVSIHQSFDDRRFNFTKVSTKEIMFSIEFQGDEHTVLVNVSPILRYHALLCPSVNKKLPQVVTRNSLMLAVETLFIAKDRDLRIVFNSLCGFASVNHLHYHLVLHKNPWPVELVKWKQLKGPLHCIQDYPVEAFCFKVQETSIQADVAQIYKVLQYLLDCCIAHNILISTRGERVAVFVYPRKSAAGVKEFGDFNVAALELSGWITVYSTEAFQNVRSEDLELELRKWKIENFEELCEKVVLLY